jgi:CRP-like cAMP-binding protein
MRLDDYRKRILDVPSIHDLPPELKSRVAMVLLWISHEEDVAAGETIYSQGAQDEDTGCVLLRGSVTITVEGDNLKQCTAPEILGEMKQFTQENERTATVRADEDATILNFYWQDLVAMSDAAFSGTDHVAINEVITTLAGRRMKEHPE